MLNLKVKVNNTLTFTYLRYTRGIGIGIRCTSLYCLHNNAEVT